jgi:hypothetical protein
MSVNNNVYKLDVGDLVERITWDAHAKKLGVVVMIGEDVPSGPFRASGPMIKVCWADNYGTFWAQPEKLKLISKGKNNV